MGPFPVGTEVDRGAGCGSFPVGPDDQFVAFAGEAKEAGIAQVLDPVEGGLEGGAGFGGRNGGEALGAQAEQSGPGGRSRFRL